MFSIVLLLVHLAGNYNLFFVLEDIVFHIEESILKMTVTQLMQEIMVALPYL